GSVLLPDGTPAAGAEVAVAAGEHGFIFINTQGLTSPPRGELIRADDAGRFELTDPGADRMVLIVHPAGFLETSTDQLRNHPRLTLHPCARVEGVLRIRDRAGSRAPVML